MAGELALKFGNGLRVNAIAPGFFLTDQNRALLTNPDGSLTDRSKTILAHTPFNRFGEPEDLYGTIHYDVYKRQECRRIEEYGYRDGAERNDYQSEWMGMETRNEPDAL